MVIMLVLANKLNFNAIPINEWNEMNVCKCILGYLSNRKKSKYRIDWWINMHWIVIECKLMELYKIKIR